MVFREILRFCAAFHSVFVVFPLFSLWFSIFLGEGKQFALVFANLR